MATLEKIDSAIATVLLRHFEFTTYMMFVTGFYSEKDDSCNTMQLGLTFFNIMSIFMVLSKIIEKTFKILKCIKLSYNLQFVKSKEDTQEMIQEKNVSKKKKQY